MMKLAQVQRDRLWTLIHRADKVGFADAARCLAAALITLDDDPSAVSSVASVPPITRAECMARLKRAFDAGSGFVVGDIQRALLDAGYDPGPVDGAWGPLTAGALGRFLAAWREGA